SKVANFLFHGICGGTGKPAFKDERARVTAAIFWMKTRAGWSETSTHKHTGVANGDPIEVEVVTVRERLTRRIARIAAARTTGGVPFGESQYQPTRDSAVSAGPIMQIPLTIEPQPI